MKAPSNRAVLVTVLVLGVLFGQDFVKTIAGPIIEVLANYVPAR